MQPQRAPKAPSGRGSLFVILPLFTQDLGWLSTEEIQALPFSLAGPRIGAKAESSGPAMGDVCNLGKARPGTASEPRDSEATWLQQAAARPRELNKRSFHPEKQ